MVWEVTWYAGLTSLPTLVSLAVASYAWRQRSRPIAPVFLALMAAISLWSLLTTVQAVTSDSVMLLLKLTFTVAATIPILWIAFTVKYARRAEWFNNRVVGLLALEPAAFVFALSRPVLTSTAPSHCHTSRVAGPSRSRQSPR